jgi:electron transport complex protein RnfG
VLYGYSFDQQAIIGFRVLDSLETPGLGDRIETDKQFLENFENLDVRVSAAGDELQHPIEFVKPGQKNAAWQIDGISGATISSTAIANMLSESSVQWIPQVRAHQSNFTLSTEQPNGN